MFVGWLGGAGKGNCEKAGARGSARVGRGESGENGNGLDFCCLGVVNGGSSKFVKSLSCACAREFAICGGSDEYEVAIGGLRGSGGPGSWRFLAFAMVALRSAWFIPLGGGGNRIANSSRRVRGVRGEEFKVVKVAALERLFLLFIENLL